MPATPRASKTPRPTPPRVVAPQPNTAAEWRAKRAAATRGEVVELPSGMFVRVLVHDPGKLMRMMKSGEVPNELVSLIGGMITGGGGAAVDVQSMDINTMGTMVEFIDRMVMNSVTEPKVYADSLTLGEEPPDDGIFISDIDFIDRSFIMSVAVGAPAGFGLEKFREQQNQALSGAQDGGGVQPAPVATAPSGRALPSVVL